MKLYKESLPENTLTVFNELFKNSFLQGSNALLMGGTALSLQINHRKSEDLDFIYFSPELPTGSINELIADLKSKGFSVVSTLNPSRISQARINGVFLENLVRDYSINGVNISFSIMNKGGSSRREHFKSAPTLELNGAFRILNIKSLFESKAVVLMDRVKSRDLFDLMFLIQNYDYTITDIVNAIKTIDQKDDREARVALEILVGNVSLDKNDPGFESISLKVDINYIYAFFARKVNEYEQHIASLQLNHIVHRMY